MSVPIQKIAFPDGKRLTVDNDDTKAQAWAVKLGLMPGMTDLLARRSGQRGVAGFARDGERLVAVLAWAGFKSKEDNGWVTFLVSPANDATASWLWTAVNRIVNADTFCVGATGWPLN